MALFSLPMSTSRSFESLFLLRALTGVAYGLCMVALTAFQAMGIPEAGRGSAFSWIAAGYVLPQLFLMPLLDGIFALGFTAPYFWIIPLLAAGCASVAWVTPDLPKRLVEGRKAWGTWAEVAGTPLLRSLLVSWVLFALANSAGLQFIPALLSERGMIPSVFIVSLATTSLAVRLAANRLMDRLPRKRLTGVSIGLIGIGTLLSLGCRSNLSLAGTGILYGLGMGIGFPTLLALIPDVFPFTLRPKGVAASFFAMDLGWIVSPLLVGGLGELGGLRVALGVTGFLGLAGGAAIQIWGWKATPPGGLASR